MTRPLASVALALAALLPACGGEQTLDQSIDALQASFDAKHFAQVVTVAEALVDRCATEGADASRVFRVEKLRVSALARQGKGDAATAELERLAGSYATQVNAKLYNQIGSYVEEAGNLLEAVSVYDAGVKRFPANAADFKPRIAQLKDRAEQAGDPETIAKLKSLGYL